MPKKNREGATPRERNIGYPGDSSLRIIGLEKSGIIPERKWHLPKKLNVKANLMGGEPNEGKPKSLKAKIQEKFQIKFEIKIYPWITEVGRAHAARAYGKVWKKFLQVWSSLIRRRFTLKDTKGRYCPGDVSVRCLLPAYCGNPNGASVKVRSRI